MTLGTLGPYTLLEEVGHGGMATVYRAHQPSVDRDVALKVILRARLDESEAIQRFQREAHLIARLEHPHILPVYDFDGRHDPPYIVMRYLNSGTLRDVMARGPLPLPEINYLIQQIGSALDYAHRQGIVHRDIKPSNIMIDQDGNAFVTDFGIARMVSGQHLTLTGTLVGTPAYMSPEQAQGLSDLDHRSDIYALGIILFQMLTGDLPYYHDNNFSLMMLHISEPIPSAFKKTPHVPPEIDTILQMALAKNPTDRYQSAADMAQALAMVIHGTLTTTPTYLRMAARTTAVSRTIAPTTPSHTHSEQNKTITALYATASEYGEWLGELHGSEVARQALKEWRTAVETAVHSFGGHIFTRAEDTIMAIWGAETAREDDAERAVRAALHLQAITAECAAPYLNNSNNAPLPLNIALNTGLALLSPQHNETYSASGATISLTQRLMQQATGTILMTHNTYAQVRGIFEVEPDTPLKLRHNRNEIPIYRVHSAKPRAFRRSSRGVEGIETRMVGRDAELKMLQNAFLDALEDKETQVFTIVSEAGLGKSRLLYEFVDWADVRPEPYWVLSCRATPELTNRPYALLRDIISFRYEIQDSDSPTAVQQKLEEGIQQQIGENEELAHLLGHLIGFDFSHSPHVKGLLGDPKQLTERACLMFHRWIEALCEQGLTMLEVEDIHLADDASLDLLTDFVARHEDLPLLVIYLARPSLYERRPTWGSGQLFHTRIDLRPLDRRESRNLVREILQNVEAVPKALRDLLVERAEGNPFYMEELVKMLIDDRIIIKQNDSVWSVEESRLGHLDVPATLVGLLQARLDNLLYPERLLLQRAAVVGRVFYDTALEAIDPIDEMQLGDITPILKQLTQQEFIHQRETTAFAGSIEYIFANTMLQDVLLSTLLQRQQEKYNQACASWLVATSGPRVAEYYGLIANYYEKAANFEQAAHYLQLAGEQALGISAFTNARTLFEQALALLPENSEKRLMLCLRLGEARFFRGDYPAARKTLESALVMAQTAVNNPIIADALYWLSQTAVMQGAYSQGQQYLEDGLVLARAGGNPQTLARILYGLGDLLWRKGKFDDARTLLNECLTLSRETEHIDQELSAMNRLAGLAVVTNQWQEATAIYEQILAKARQIGNRDRESSTLNNLGVVAYDRQDWPTSLRYTEQALALARETGNPNSMAMLLNNMADTSMRMGNFAAAQQYLQEGLTVAQQIGATPFMLTAVQTAGALLARQGQFEQGVAIIGMSLNHSATTTEHHRTGEDCLQFLGVEASDTAVQTLLAQGSQLQLEDVVQQILTLWANGQP